MKIGFIIYSRVPAFKALGKGMPLSAMCFGWDDAKTTMSYMRFRWISRFVPKGIQYELYRPWRTYDAVVFVKSMGTNCIELISRVRKVRTRIVFEANVDYYTRWDGIEAEVPMPIMAPTLRQQADAETITKEADAVIASSRHLTAVCGKINPHSHWVPDNILPEFCIRSSTHWQAMRDGKLQVWWSGMACKLFELLAAEESLRRFRKCIHLHMVVDDVARGKAQWRPELQVRFEKFLQDVPHTFHHYKSIPHLLKLYSTGGVLIAPRFLEYPYNLGHSEWKITLGMVCGLSTLGSPVPSYEDVAERIDHEREGGRDALRICRTPSDWEEALEWTLSRPPHQPNDAAREVVRRHYLTPVVAERHWEAVKSVLS